MSLEKSKFHNHIVKMTYFESNPEWVWYDDEDLPHLTEKATPEAVESYNYWKKHYDKSQDTGAIFY